VILCRAESSERRWCLSIAQYGTSVVYNFPKTKLVDGPLQIEARIDQNAQLSGQLTLWNQQGSHVRRGALLVIRTGHALLYAEPIYLQAERSPNAAPTNVEIASNPRGNRPQRFIENVGSDT
jgi:uncharacterized membrane protein (UPF0182 family)